MPKLGFNFQPSAPDLPWDEYFREYREQLETLKGTLAEDDEEYIDLDISVVEPARIIDNAEAPAAVLKLWKVTQALGWSAKVSRSVTHHPAVRFKTGERVGEIKTAEHDRRHYSLSARDDAGKTGFVAIWEGRGEGKSANFQDIILRDPVGVPDELFFDYGDAHRNAEYNDGTTWVHHTKVYTAVSAMNQWLQDWLDLLAPDFPPLIKAKEETPNNPNEWRETL